MQITPKLVNLNLQQIQYLIDLVFDDIKTEKRAYEEGYNPYQRKGLPTQRQCQDHQAKAMEQHGILKQLYVIAQYSVLTEVEMYPERFSKEDEVEFKVKDVMKNIKKECGENTTIHVLHD